MYDNLGERETNTNVSKKKSSNGFMFGKMASTSTHTSLTYLALQVLKQHYVCTDSIQRLRAASEIWVTQ